MVGAFVEELIIARVQQASIVGLNVKHQFVLEYQEEMEQLFRVLAAEGVLMPENVHVLPVIPGNHCAILSNVTLKL